MYIMCLHYFQKLQLPIMLSCFDDRKNNIELYRKEIE
jgi:hypothetical protein